MSLDRSLTALESAIASLQAWFDRERVPALFIGGIAVSLVGRPRTTKDVDAVVWLPDHTEWAAFVEAGKLHGIVPRIPDCLAFALSSRVLLLRHAPSGVDVDVSLGALPFEETAIQNASLARIGTLQIPIPTPEDLVVMKAIAHRPRDMSDIETILDAHPDLDTAQVMQTFRLFAEALELPEIADDLARLFARCAPRSAPDPKPKGHGTASGARIAWTKATSGKQGQRRPRKR